MKVDICSDLHLEFQTVEIANTNQSDVLILAGDIVCAESIKRHPFESLDSTKCGISKHRVNSMVYRDFFDSISKQYSHIIYVPGNHEYYGGEYHRLNGVLVDMLSEYDNIHLLMRDSIVVDDVTFIGATLWTNYLDSHLVEFTAQYQMNDYKCIKFRQNATYRRIRTADIKEINSRDSSYIFDQLRSCDTKSVVVTHHAPTLMSIDPTYAGDPLNGAYVNDYANTLAYDIGPNVWVHGHIHHGFDYILGDTRVVCSPFGYPGEMANSQIKTIEV